MANSSKIHKLLLFFLALSVSGCATVYNPATKQNEMLLIDTESEIRLGEDMDREVRKEFQIVADWGMQQRLDSAGTKIAMVSDRKDLVYQFKVIKDDELNAFTIPGGYVYVNSGLMQAASDDELAGVLAHEIGHIAAKHAVKKLQSVMGYQLIMAIALGVSNQQAMAQAMDIVFNLGSLGYSRQDELLADTLAVKYTMAAGFKPQAIVTFLEKLKAERDKKGPGADLVFLSSHPPLEDRIANIKKEIATLDRLPQADN